MKVNYTIIILYCSRVIRHLIISTLHKSLQFINTLLTFHLLLRLPIHIIILLIHYILLLLNILCILKGLYSRW